MSTENDTGPRRLAPDTETPIAGDYVVLKTTDGERFTLSMRFLQGAINVRRDGLGGWASQAELVSSTGRRPEGVRP